MLSAIVENTETGENNYYLQKLVKKAALFVISINENEFVKLAF